MYFDFFLIQRPIARLLPEFCYTQKSASQSSTGSFSWYGNVPQPLTSDQTSLNLGSVWAFAIT
jgi:hypothetical protein